MQNGQKVDSNLYKFLGVSSSAYVFHAKTVVAAIILSLLGAAQGRVVGSIVRAFAGRPVAVGVCNVPTNDRRNAPARR